MMIKTKFNRSILAALIVLGPALLITYYEIDGKEKFDMPGVVAVLTEPMFAPEKGTPKTPKKLLKLQKGAKDNRQPEQENKSEVQSTETKTNIAASDTSQDAVVIDSDRDKKELAIDAVVVKKIIKKPALHQGKIQKGMLLPNLHLEVDSATVKELLCKKEGFLLAEVGRQRYVLGVTHCDNPYRNTQVGYLTDYPMISDRYLSLPGEHFSRGDLETLNDSVIRRTGSRETPRYNLVFSSSYNKYLIDEQLTKVREQKLDLEKLHNQQTPVSIHGELHREDHRVRLRVIAVKVGGETIDL
ncbi:hypothetical protein SAMN02746065_1458 [Desulfocicer vacuolatum DSM 3385]|uniref:Uncharacterized protein n=1 Tax=Desulfocicer vacuolatum DSM 3385 TaxID=1121400 RepID=A0A1W2ETM5_9BACT|nr:hypothetical protein [Desulfocicer vacuolatum]SMD13049.1 hypothetical protein SAMN02746065_1458 [Desulfocicer vacuolatum DSM 3385]